MTEKLMDEILRTIAAVKNQLDARVSAHETRLLALEARPVQPAAVKFQGVWQRASEYTRDESATFDGSMWTCITDRTRAQPGTDPRAWQLSQKKDAR